MKSYLLQSLFLDNRINGIPVVDEAGHLVGILCQSDLIAQQKRLPIPSFFTFMDGIFSTSSVKQFEKQVQKNAAITVAQAMKPNPVFVKGRRWYFPGNDGIRGWSRHFECMPYSGVTTAFRRDRNGARMIP